VDKGTRGSGTGREEILAADVDHGAGWFEETGFTDMVASFLFIDGADDVVGELGIGLAAAHAAVEVVFNLGEEAGTDFAVGGETDAAASTAERLADGSDDADFTDAVGEGVAASGFAGLAWRDRYEGQFAVDSVRDFL
jgi:hypothetical protein